MKRALQLVLAVWCIPVIAQAQRFGGSVAIYNAQHRVLFGDSVLEQTGMLFGVSGTARLGRLELRAAGMFGSLSGDSAAVNPERQVRVSTLSAYVVASPVLAVGLDAEAKRFETDLGVTVWRLVGPSLRLTPSLGGTGLSGLAEVSYFAMAQVIGGASMGPAMRGTFGVQYQSPRGPLSVSLAYRMERFDFDASTGGRLEQLRGATAGIGLRF
jgi:hypothetical protein